MTNKEILRKLILAREVKPEARWVKNSRADLLFKIKKSCSDAKQQSREDLFGWLKLNFGFVLNLIFPKFFADNIVRPLAISFIGAIVVFGGMAAIGVSQKAMSGNILYPVKIVCENIQLSFAANIEEKTKLEMEFAGRRIEELNKLVAANKLSYAKLDDKIANITANLQKNIQTANIHLDELDKSGKADSALKIAKDIDNKISYYAVALNNLNQNAADKSKVAEALSKVDEVGDRALKVIVTKHKSAGNGISDSEIAEKLNQKIAFAITEIDREKDSKIENQELNQTLQEAKNFIQTGDFAAALNKITEGKDIIKELRAKMEEEETQKQNEFENVSGEEISEQGNTETRQDEVEVGENEDIKDKE